MFKDLDIKVLEIGIRHKFFSKEKEEEERVRLEMISLAVHGYRKEWEEKVSNSIETLIRKMVKEKHTRDRTSVTLAGTSDIFFEFLMPVIQEIQDALNSKPGVRCIRVDVTDGRMASLLLEVSL
jgi:hypothetical protein